MTKRKTPRKPSLQPNALPPPVHDLLEAQQFREAFQWQKVTYPKAWRPVQVGEELLGYYGGRTLRTGGFGQYEVVLVHTLNGSMTVSGTELIQLLDAAIIEKGHPIRILWKGVDEIPGGKTKKRYELLVAKGEHLKEEDLPRVRVA